MANKDKKMLKVTVKTDGFRRAGRSWQGSTIIEADKLSKEELKALKDDSNFIVEDSDGTDLDAKDLAKENAELKNEAIELKAKIEALEAK